MRGAVETDNVKFSLDKVHRDKVKPGGTEKKITDLVVGKNLTQASIVYNDLSYISTEAS